MMHSDLLILGSGPAGSALAILLAKAGLSVTVLDSASHPRHHVGESLLPASMPFLHDLGLSHDLLASRYQPKSGARFYDPATDQLATFAFEPPPSPHSPSPAYQVLREDFDALLADRARAAGCTLLGDASIETLNEDSDLPSVTLFDGRTLTARFLADATGRTALIAAKRREKKLIPAYGRLAIYNYFENLPPHDHLDPHFITMYVFSAHGGGWVWLIPLKDGRTSVGIVLRNPPPASSKSPPFATAGPISASPQTIPSKPESLFHQAAQSMPRLASRLSAATPTDPYRAIADYSFTVQHKFGPPGKTPTWLALGDAAGFLDPIFSSGVHLALASAHRAAPAIIETLQTGRSAPLEAYVAHVDAGFCVFAAFVDRFYNRDLVHNLFFMKNKPPATHRALTQILAGHIWDPSNSVIKMLTA